MAGNNLFVAQYGGDVEDCTLAADSVSNCHTVATTTGAGSSSDGGGSVALFP